MALQLFAVNRRRVSLNDTDEQRMHRGTREKETAGAAPAV
jgi:hypothetical protein